MKRLVIAALALSAACSSKPADAPVKIEPKPNDPQHAAITTPHGDHSPHHGGIVMMNGDKEIPHAGTYLEIDPHSRLVFTWESPYSLDDSVVTIDLTEPEPGRTDLKLRHVKFRSEEARDGHREGWTTIVGNLASILG